jgi:acetyl-CoA carboxylase biotin carboxyl carrier protein
MDLTEDEVTQILKWIEESSFDELDLTMGEMRLVVRKGRDGSPVKEEVAGKALTRAGVPEPAGMEAGKEKSLCDVHGMKGRTGESLEEGLSAIPSPMLGTFYRGPAPGAPPYVEVGSFVEEGDTVCLIEVMKVFNAVKTGVRGYIAKIFPETGQLVEYGQTLFFVSPADRVQENEIKA